MNVITPLLLIGFALLLGLKLVGLLSWSWLAVSTPLLLCVALFATLGVLFRVWRIEHYGRE
jgi:hypothetical protein